MRILCLVLAAMLFADTVWAGAADSEGSAGTPLSLAIPGPLQASTSSTQVSLKWANISYESGYVVYRRLKGTSNFSVIAKTGADRTTYADPFGASNVFEYRVRGYVSRSGLILFSQYTNSAFSTPATTPTPVPSTSSSGGTTPQPSTLSITAGPSVSEITTSSAKVQWSLTGVATGQVQYGLTTSYGSATPPELSFNYSTHVQTIAGLAAGTTYHLRVVSKNASGVQVVSPDLTFTTVLPTTCQ